MLLYCWHKIELYGAFLICKKCGILQYQKDGRRSRTFRGKNLTYTVLKELQPNKLAKPAKPRKKKRVK